MTTKTAQRTPGPWRLRHGETATYIVGPFNGIGNPTICDFPRHASQTAEQVDSVLYDARLIAVAPALLETARALLKRIDNMTSEGFRRGEEKPEREALRTAIAKTAGREEA